MCSVCPPLLTHPPLLSPQTTLRAFKEPDFSSVREHDEFIWLHDRFVENDEYAGIIVSESHTP